MGIAGALGVAAGVVCGGENAAEELERGVATAMPPGVVFLGPLGSVGGVGGVGNGRFAFGRGVRFCELSAIIFPFKDKMPLALL